MYIDGSAAVTNQAVNEYNGMGTIYLSGYLTVDGMMCGKRNADQSPTATSRTGTRTPRC